MRGGDGNAVESVRLHWSGPASDVSMQRKMTRAASGIAVVTIVEDFAPIVEAVAALQRNTLDGTSDALSAQAFRRASVLPVLYRRLGLASPRWCCVDDAKMSAPQATEAARMATENGSPLSVPELAFYRHCALCHRSSDSAPPNFLTGTQQQVRANLAHCTQRLYVRLAMWDHAAEGRTKTPMPPFTALRGARIGESEWRSGSDLAALRGYVAKILQEEPGKFASPEALLHTNYEHLRTCLP